MHVINHEPCVRNALNFSLITSIRDLFNVNRGKDDFAVIRVLIGENFKLWCERNTGSAPCCSILDDYDFSIRVIQKISQFMIFMNVLNFGDFFLSRLWSIIHTFCTTVVTTFLVWLATAIVNVLVPIKILTAKIAEAICTSVRNELIKFKKLVAFVTDSTFDGLAFRHWDLTKFD